MNSLLHLLPLLFMILVTISSCEKRKIERKVEDITACCFANAPKRLVYYEEDGLDRTNWFIDSVLECSRIRFKFNRNSLSDHLSIIYHCPVYNDSSLTGNKGVWDVIIRELDSIPVVNINFELNSKNYLKYKNIYFYLFKLTNYNSQGFTIEGFDEQDSIYKKIRYENW